MKRIVVEAHRAGAIAALRAAEMKLPLLVQLNLAEELVAKRDNKMEAYRDARECEVPVRHTVNPNRPLYAPFAGLALS